MRISSPGKGQITLEFSVNEETEMAVFSVTDTGCGIPKEKQKLVFERFEKLNEYAQGTGLGLSICKLIVHKWKGIYGSTPNIQEEHGSYSHIRLK